MGESRDSSDQRTPAIKPVSRWGEVDAERETLVVDDEDLLEVPEPIGLGARAPALPASAVRSRSRSSPPASSGDLRSGMLLAGKYRLFRPLAEGGMGTVWLGRNEELELDVAIKAIRTDVALPNLAARLLNEARAVAKLRHPGIVRVLDYGSTDAGVPYLVMEKLTGLTLHEHLQTYGRMEPLAAVSLLLPAAAALDAAHRKQIIHRDFKPENVILAEGDDARIDPRVVDFGVAKPVTTTTGRLTSDGGVVGSPHYLSPEQAKGEDVDHRTDIWSFAIVLYEMVTNRLPFSAENYHALLQAIIHSAPPPPEVDGLVDDELWGIIQRGLAKNPLDRWDSMQEFGVALAQWLFARGVTVDIAGRSVSATWLRPSNSAGRAVPSDQRVSDAKPRSRPDVVVEGGACPRRGARRNTRIGATAILTGCGIVLGLAAWFLTSEEGGKSGAFDTTPTTVGDTPADSADRDLVAEERSERARAPHAERPAPRTAAGAVDATPIGGEPIAAGSSNGAGLAPHESAHATPEIAVASPNEPPSGTRRSPTERLVSRIGRRSSAVQAPPPEPTSPMPELKTDF